MGKTFHLKRKTDQFTGTAGKDNFLAPAKVIDSLSYPTWTNKDVLDGGRGADTLTAFVGTDSLKPRMTRIETAVLSRMDGDLLTLDLAKASGLRAITLDDFWSDATISHAARLKSFSMSGNKGEGGAGHFQISGVNATKVGTASYQFENAWLGLDVQTLKDRSFKAVNLALIDSAVDLSGDIGAKTVTIHSNGPDQNRLTMIAGALDTTETIKIDGAERLYFKSGKADNLLSLDASAMTDELNATIDAIKLTSLKTGSGSDTIKLIALGGTADHKAMVDLGGGNDSLDLRDVAIDPALHSFAGGDGFDNIAIKIPPIGGSSTDVAAMFQGFETLYIYTANGTFDLAGSGIDRVSLYEQQGQVTVNSFADGGVVDLSNGGQFGMNVNVEGAAGSTTDNMSLYLYGGTFGSASSGFSSPALSNLVIASLVLANTLYLGQLGAKGDGATVTIGGNQALTVKAVSNSTSFIDTLSITNTAGVDISGLADGQLAFATSGAIITSGDGSDTLVGGTGDDVIETGAGFNIVHSSLGADAIILAEGSGVDTIFFNHVNHSTGPEGGIGPEVDKIYNFGGLDTINLSNIVDNVVFAGNFETFAAGDDWFSSAVATAIFVTANDTLYVDINKDGAITSGQDLVVDLPGLESFNDFYLYA